MNLLLRFFFFLWCTGSIGTLSAQKIAYTVTVKDPAAHLFEVEMRVTGIKAGKVDFKMPIWSPGYYQRMNYAEKLLYFSATTVDEKPVAWQKKSQTTWEVDAPKGEILLRYAILADRKFVANSYVDEERGYIVPTSVFLYPAGLLHLSSTVTAQPWKSWNNVATGLEPVKGAAHTFSATNYDELYDSPILMGQLEELPTFMVKGIPHRFIGYKLGQFDRVKFVDDLKKIIEKASDIIGDIPYKHYTFLAIGPGQGGIEHANSTAISFDGSSLNTPEGRIRMLNFLAHEYFHHYNVKRIRPVELGPFDYENGNRTKMLWVSEGLTVYYEYLILKRAGITDEKQLLQSLRNNLLAFENKPGRLYQSLAEASFETWSDGPFGRTGEEANKTISYYDKGPVVGWLLDLKIRHETQNKKSLDDVMRMLYRQYYQSKKRGFTEAEFKELTEKITNTSIDDILAYVTTTHELDYPRYLQYAGLAIDTTTKTRAGAWLGASTRMRNDTLVVTNVEWPSPAWDAKLRRQTVVLEIDGHPAGQWNDVLEQKKSGDIVKIVYLHNNERKETMVTLGVKKEKEYSIKPVSNVTPLQKAIFDDWAR